MCGTLRFLYLWAIHNGESEREKKRICMCARLFLGPGRQPTKFWSLIRIFIWSVMWLKTNFFSFWSNARLRIRSVPDACKIERTNRLSHTQRMFHAHNNITSCGCICHGAAYDITDARALCACAIPMRIVDECMVCYALRYTTHFKQYLRLRFIVIVNQRHFSIVHAYEIKIHNEQMEYLYGGSIPRSIVFSISLWYSFFLLPLSFAGWAGFPSSDVFHSFDKY